MKARATISTVMAWAIAIAVPAVAVLPAATAEAAAATNCATVAARYPNSAVVNVTATGDIAAVLKQAAAGTVLCLPAGDFQVSGGAVNLKTGAVIVAEDGTTVTRSSTSSPLLRLSTDSLVYGGTWDGNGVQAVFRTTDGVTGTAVEHLTVTDGAYGIQFVNSASGSLTDVSATANSSNGVLINSRASATITNLIVTNNGANGLRLDAASGTSSISGVVATGNQGTAGIAIVGSSATLSNARSNQNAGHGILISKAPSVTISDSAFSQNALYGAQVTGSSIAISDSEFNGNARRGLQLGRDDASGATSTATVESSQFSDNATDILKTCNSGSTTCHGQGIGLSGQSTLTLTSSTMTNNGNNGLFVGSGSTATLSGNTLSGNQYHSVEVQGAGSAATFMDNNVIEKSGLNSAATEVSGIGVYEGGAVSIEGTGNKVIGGMGNGITANQKSTLTIDGAVESSDNAGQGIGAYGSATISGAGAITINRNGQYGLYANSASPDTATVSLTGACVATDNKAGISRQAGTASVTSNCQTETTKPISLAVTLTGKTWLDQKVSAKVGQLSPSTASLSYEWLVDGQVVAGATQSSYTVAAGDMCRKLSVRVTASASGWSPATVTSAAVTLNFSDQPGKDFYEDICWAARNGVTTGSNGKYLSDDPVTRGQMAAFIYRLMGSPAYTAPAVSRFADLTPGSAFYREINWLYDRKITTGWGSSGGKPLFRPNLSVTRGQMAAFLFRAAGSPAYTAPGVSPFSDLAVGADFYLEINWLYAQKITTGFTSSSGKPSFRPNTAVTRGQMAAFLHRYNTAGLA
jgi:parallel beta-helix repeat protein